MEKIVLVYGMLLILTLAVWAAFIMNRDESQSRKLAKIRVRFDETRQGRNMPEPREEDFEPPEFIKWWLVGVGLLLLFLILGKG